MSWSTSLLCTAISVAGVAGKACAESDPLGGVTHRLTLPPRGGEKIKEANYTLWLPAGVETIRAIIVHQHGCGKGAQNAGRTASDDLHWRLLAEHTGSALLGTSIWPKWECRDWSDPAGGSGRAFLEALDTFAKRSGHEELRQIPWVVWGHSGGGFWAHRMLRMHPDRFAGVVLLSAGFGPQDQWPLPKLSDEVPTDVPMLIHVGRDEEGHERFNPLFENGVSLFEELRAKDAPVALAIDPESGHDCGDCRYLTIPWILSILAEPKNSPVQRDTPGAEAKSWLPDSEVAALWEEFVDSGQIVDKTPPDTAPTGLEAKVGKEGIILTWKATPDLESGIKTFRIYRDGELLPPYVASQARGPKTTEVFRQPNYSDTPNQPLSQMRYVDTAPLEEGLVNYQVTTVNWCGLESPMSQPLPFRLKN